MIGRARGDGLAERQDERRRFRRAPGSFSSFSDGGGWRGESRCREGTNRAAIFGARQKHAPTERRPSWKHRQHHPGLCCMVERCVRDRDQPQSRVRTAPPGFCTRPVEAVRSTTVMATTPIWHRSSNTQHEHVRRLFLYINYSTYMSMRGSTPPARALAAPLRRLFSQDERNARQDQGEKKKTCIQKQSLSDSV